MILRHAVCLKRSGSDRSVSHSEIGCNPSSISPNIVASNDGFVLGECAMHGLNCAGAH